MDTTVTDSPVTLTAAAAGRIRAVLGEGSGRLLRVSVIGGGCSGFSYRFGFDDDAPAADDLVLERDGARVAIDAVSLPLLAGSEIDYVDELIGSAFRVRNPNATASCGCGTSFSV
jgi:iron-sulfur cluster assembly accessory protein